MSGENGDGKGLEGSPLGWAPRDGEREVVDLPLYTLAAPRGARKGAERREGEPLAARALYYIIGGHFGPPKSLSEHKKYEVLLGPPFFRAASGAASPDRAVTEKGGAREEDRREVRRARKRNGRAEKERRQKKRKEATRGEPRGAAVKRPKER